MNMPGSTTSTREVYWVYVLRSERDRQHYIGYTVDLKTRLRQHFSGKSFSTSYRGTVKLIYAEVCTCYSDAKRREKYLKTTGGRRFLAKRLKDYYKHT